MSLISNLSSSRRRSSSVVGLDIQPGYVAAVQARVNGGVVIQRAAEMALPADTVREGEVLNVEALSETLRALFDGSDLDRHVRIGVANQRTVLRTLELPPVTDRKELAAAVRFQAEDQVPMPLSNAVLDFHPLGVVETPGGPRQRVVLVAAQRDMVERLLTAVRNAGLRPAGIDLSAFALIRALYQGDGGGDDGRVMYLNVGGLTNMAIAEGTTCHFTRVVSGGLEAMAVEVAERRQMSLEQARELLRMTSLRDDGNHTEVVAYLPTQAAAQPEEPSDYEDHYDDEFEVPDLNLGRPAEVHEFHHEQEVEHPYPVEAEHPLPEEVDDYPPTEVQQPAEPVEEPHVTYGHDEMADVRIVLENGVREIAGEVRNSLDFHRSQDGGGKVSVVVLSGAALEIDGFAERLEHDLGLKVRCQTVGFSNPDAQGSTSAQRLAIAAGLAVEEVPS